MSRGSLLMTLISMLPLTLPAIAPESGSSATSLPENGVCEADELCLYSDDAYAGYVYDFPQCDNDRSHRFDTFPGTDVDLADNVESVWNRSGYVYAIYDRTQYKGSSKSIFPYQKVDSLGSVEDDNRSHQCTGS